MESYSLSFLGLVCALAGALFSLCSLMHCYFMFERLFFLSATKHRVMKIMHLVSFYALLIFVLLMEASCTPF